MSDMSEDLSESERYAKLTAAFQACRSLPKDRREPFLQQLLGSDEGLVREVLVLLDLEAEDDPLADNRIDQRPPLVAPLPAQPAGDLFGQAIPSKIGSYTLISRIGQGGMGVVFEAESSSPRRRVALKLIRAGAAGASSLSRFEREAAALARLQHPGIAQLYEYGSYESAQGSQPYFALELIDGADLRTYVEREHLDLRARLALVAQVADAVQHAHECGIVHRDLKPENILVDGSGRPKVLDFGVARILDDDRASVAATLTETGQLVGTLSYMAPEQLGSSPEPIGPRTDVYALGVIAFELVAGELPHSIAGLPPAVGLRMIAEREPSSLDHLVPDVPDDVATIVGKALARDPQRRYSSAAALAADLRRFLAHKPIAARPPSRVYRARMFARRNRGLVLGLAATGLTLVVGLIATMVFAVGEHDQRRLAERYAYRASMLAASTAIQKGHKVRQLLESVPAELRGWEWRHLESRLSTELVRLPARVGEQAIVIEPNRGSLLVGTVDGTLWRIDEVTGEVLLRIELPGAPHFMELRRLGAEVMICGMVRASEPNSLEAWVGVWDLQTGSQVLTHTLRAFGGTLSSNSDGTRICGADDHGVFLMDVLRGERLAAVDLPPVFITRFGRESSLIVAGGHSGELFLLDSNTLELKWRSNSTEGGLVCGLDVRPREASFASAMDDGTLQLWNVEKATPQERTLLTTPDGGFGNTRFTPDGRSLLYLSSDRVIRIFDSKTGELQRQFTGHTGRPGAVAFWPGGDRMATGDTIGAVHVWGLAEDPLKLTAHRSYVNPVALTSDGSILASGGWDGYYGHPGSLRLWDVRSGKLLAAIGEPGEHVSDLEFSQDASTLTVLFRRAHEEISSVVQFDMRTGARRNLQTRPDIATRFAVAPSGEQVIWSERSNRVCIASNKQDGLLLDRLMRSPPAEFEVNSAWSRDAAWIAVAHGSGEVEVWRGDTFEVVQRRGDYGTGLISVAFDPQCNRLAGAFADGTTRIWSIPELDELAVLQGDEQQTMCASFSPDGSRIATGARDGTIRIWDGVTYESIVDLTQHEGYVYSLEWSQDGELLVSGSGDNSVRFWSTRPASEWLSDRDARARSLERVETLVIENLSESSPEESADWIDARSNWSAAERRVAHQVLLHEVLSVDQALPSQDAGN